MPEGDRSSCTIDIRGCCVSSAPFFVVQEEERGSPGIDDVVAYARWEV